MNRDKVANMVDPPDGLKDQLTNALIMAGLSFFTTLSGMAITQVICEPEKALIASAISAGLSFFTTLALQRGLVKKD